MAVLLHVELGIIEVQSADVANGVRVVFHIFYLHAEVPLVAAVLFGQVEGVLVVSSLATHLNGNIHVEVDGVLLRKFVQLGLVLQLRVAIQKQGGVVLVG